MLMRREGACVELATAAQRKETLAAIPGALAARRASAGRAISLSLASMALARFAATVGGYTLASRVLGLVRDILMAAVLGAGPVADAFFVAFKLPNFFRRLFAEGAFNAAFVPVFSGLVERRGRAHAFAFADAALGLLLLVLLLFTAVAQAAMPWLMLGLAPGFTASPEKFDLAVTLTRLAFPYLMLISLVSLLAGVLNTLGRFAAAAAAPVLLNLCLIAALALFADSLETPGHGLAVAVSVAGVVQLLWLLLAAARAGYLPRLAAPRLTPEVRELLRLMLPAALGAGVVQINLVIDLILASTLPEGSISFLFYADRLNQLPIGVVGVAVGTALLPIVSRQIARGETKAAATSLNRAIELSAILTIPAAAALVILPEGLIAALYERGAFTPATTEASAAALAAYAVGLPAYILVKVLTPAYFARLDTRTPVRIAIAAVAVNLVLNLILMQFLAHVGLALASAIAAWFNVALLAAILHGRGHLTPDRRLGRRLLGIVAAAAVMSLALLAALAVLDELLADPTALRIVVVAALVVGGGGLYALAALAFRAVRPREILALARGRHGG